MKKTPKAIGIRFTAASVTVLEEFDKEPRVISRNEFINRCIAAAGPKILKRKNSCACAQEALSLIHI